MPTTMLDSRAEKPGCFVSFGGTQLTLIYLAESDGRTSNHSSWRRVSRPSIDPPLCKTSAATLRAWTSDRFGLLPILLIAMTHLH